MGSQLQRRTNPYPWTWELPLAVGCTILLALTMGMHLGRSLATGIGGAGWEFTTRRELFTSLPAIVGGDAGAGLARPLAAPVPTRTLLGSIVSIEVALLALIVWAAIVGLRRWGPARMRGMATGSEVEQLLGLSRLRRNAHIIRPDLHRPSRRWR